jgi:hypothetical protein
MMSTPRRAADSGIRVPNRVPDSADLTRHGRTQLATIRL